MAVTASESTSTQRTYLSDRISVIRGEDERVWAGDVRVFRSLASPPYVESQAGWSTTSPDALNRPDQEINVRIAVYGASGYQAKLVLVELTGRDMDVVLVGRNATRLRDAATAVGIVDAAQRVADADDHDALVPAFRDCDAVINCAGPFTRSGHAVVRAAISAGCHYVDTAGEQFYIKSVYDLFARDAERAGVTVVPATNDACLPSDLIARLLAELIQPIEEIAVSHFIVGGAGPSRGSLRSVAESIDAIGAGGLSYDDGDWHTGIPARHASVTLPGTTQPTDVVKFPLSEVVTIPRHVRVQHVEGLVDAALGARLGTPLTSQIIESLPEGPSVAARRTQRFTYLVDATGREGQSARGVVQGPDTYGTTALIAVEAARRLVEDGAEPGVLAPAQAYDPTSFLDFLTPYGISRTISVSGTSPTRH
ncbi:saccharopine dehydrogenase family protein [Plantactinospora sonchi]|uniref:Saccharopine dehydrogenase NADP-binding domain-containing protein n=1 Tax=Plantactinospora sonchi TaxID=1544735 RepID=A0ABU7RWD8_9ACTN